MKTDNSLGLIFVFFLVFSSPGVVFSQVPKDVSPAAPAAQPVFSLPDSQWVWGEVSMVDAPGSKLAVKYLDYENDLEKEIIIGVNDKTTYENFASIAELKPKDTVSIDYSSGPGGVNTAKNIIMEKPEEALDASIAPAVDLKSEGNVPEAAPPQENVSDPGMLPHVINQMPEVGEKVK
jgi:hypothetical protein